jgi:hypothetical protein
LAHRHIAPFGAACAPAVRQRVGRMDNVLFWGRWFGGV